MPGGKDTNQPAIELTSYEIHKGLRVVNNEKVHVNQLFPSKLQKLKTLLENIPCLTVEDQKDILRTREFNTIRRHVEVSIAMAGIAQVEYKKMKRGSLVKFFRSRFSSKEGQLVEALYLRMEPLLVGLESSWKRAFEELSQGVPAGTRMGVTKETLASCIKLAKARNHYVLDSFLPKPILS